MYPSHKEPRNQLENPVRPYIPKAAPRFQYAGKHWRVEVGKTMNVYTEGMSGANEGLDPFGGAVRSTSKYNQAPYGAISHRDKITHVRRNLTNYYDYIPVNRRPWRAERLVRPRLNPVSPWKANNVTGGMGLERYLTDKVTTRGAGPPKPRLISSSNSGLGSRASPSPRTRCPVEEGVTPLKRRLDNSKYHIIGEEINKLLG